jgi:protein-S-isoprenylcysteine O-methyltransferase Ste14
MQVLLMQTLAIRAYALLVPLLAAAAAWVWQQPSGRKAGAVYLATLWTIPSLVAVQFLAGRYEWWSFRFAGAPLAWMPAELFLGWMLLWGTLPALLLRRLSLPVVVGVAVTLDIVVMPLGAPVIQLGPRWMVGEVVAAALVLIPAQLLARWTAQDTRLAARVLLQVVLFTGTVVMLLPSWLLNLGLQRWSDFAAMSSLSRQVFLQTAMLVALIGVTAVQEFAERGRGTPFPYDPPKVLVRTGIYAYVRNPMQLSTTLLFVLLAVAMRSIWLGAAAFILFAFAAGFAAWDEGGDMKERYGDAAAEYAAAVRTWIPSWRPFIPEPATIYFAAGCDPCVDSAAWLRRRNPRGLLFVHAELHPTAALERVRYERPDGSYEEGVPAIARALEHIHLGWALLGFAARLPLARPLLQLIVDASGGEKRSLGPIR